MKSLAELLQSPCRQKAGALATLPVPPFSSITCSFRPLMWPHADRGILGPVDIPGLIPEVEGTAEFPTEVQISVVL